MKKNFEENVWKNFRRKNFEEKFEEKFRRKISKKNFEEIFEKKFEEKFRRKNFEEKFRRKNFEENFSRKKAKMFVENRWMLDSRIRNADENRSMVGFQRRSERLSRKEADNRADNC